MTAPLLSDVQRQALDEISAGQWDDLGLQLIAEAIRAALAEIDRLRQQVDVLAADLATMSSSQFDQNEVLAMNIVQFECEGATKRVEPHSLREVAGECVVHGFDLGTRTNTEWRMRDIRNWRRDGEPVLTEADQREVTQRVSEAKEMHPGK